MFRLAWTPLKSVSLDSGYRILLEGQVDVQVLIKFWMLMKLDELIVKVIGFLDQSLSDGWEDEFGDLIQVDVRLAHIRRR